MEQFEKAYEESGLDGLWGLLYGMELKDQISKLNEIGRHFYWKKRTARPNLDIALGLDTMIDASSSDDEKGAFKAICFNVASFNWDGWGEEDIELDQEMIQQGFRFAYKNLEFAQELNKGDIPMARAHWMVGGLCLSMKRNEEAIDHFNKSADFAAKGGSPSEAKLSQAFSLLTQKSPELESKLKEFEGEKDGDFFIQQVRTAGKVFGLL